MSSAHLAVVARCRRRRTDVCDSDPGYEVTATVQTSLRALIRIWRGDCSWQQALLDGSAAVSWPRRRPSGGAAAGVSG